MNGNRVHELLNGGVIDLILTVGEAGVPGAPGIPGYSYGEHDAK